MYPHEHSSPNDDSYDTKNLHYLLAAVRRTWPCCPGAQVLLGPAESDGYADLVVDAISYAWTSQGDAAHV